MAVDEELITYLETFNTDERNAKIDEILHQRTQHFTVLIEDVYQMHNASAVIRSCEIFGIQDLHALTVKNALRPDTEIALGAQKWVDLHSYTDRDSCIAQLKKEGYQLVATTPREGATPLHEFDFTKKSVFIFGTEKTGISPELLAQADTYLTIPMYGFTESLNISVSVAIILQYMTQKLHASTINWALTEEKKKEKKLDWLKKSIKSINPILTHYYQQKLNK